MPSPFPGMDPYLEGATRWRDFHTRMMTAVSDQLNPQLRPKYVVRVEERVYVSDETDPGRTWFAPDLHVVTAGRPAGTPAPRPDIRSEPAGDVAEAVDVSAQLEEDVRERFLTIVDVSSRDVVTVIEILSPTNKIRGSRGRAEYESKRRDVTRSGSHLVEIDLLRRGDRVFVPRDLPRHDYSVYLSRRTDHARAGWVWPILLRQHLPVVPIPLRDGDADAKLNLQAAVTDVYDRANYDLEIDYATAPEIPLSPDAAAWADELLRSKRLR
jgi:hypothetical protein